MNGRIKIIFLFLFISILSSQIQAENATIGSITEITLDSISPGEVSTSFGRSLTGMGDLDNDGNLDLAIGAPSDATVHILTLNEDFTLKTSLQISDQSGGIDLPIGSAFGSSIALIGDVDNDGIPDLAVGDPQNIENAFLVGAVYILLMNPNATVKSHVKILGKTEASFGKSLTGIGDLNDDGIPDLAVGSTYSSRGELTILFLNDQGEVDSNLTISDGTAGLSISTTDSFGFQLGSIQDLNQDGIPEILVSATGANDSAGLVYILFMERNGTIKDYVTIPSGAGYYDTVQNFGLSVAWIPHLETDQNQKYIAIGGYDEDKGAIYLTAIQLNQDDLPTIQSVSKIASGIGGLHVLAPEDDLYGISVANLLPPILTDFSSSNQGKSVMAVGVDRFRNSNDNNQGAVFISSISKGTSSNNDQNNLPVILGIIIPLLFLSCLCIILIIAVISIISGGIFWKKRGSSGTSIDLESGDEMIKSDSRLEWSKTTWQIDYKDLIMEQPPMASGSFGVVNKADYRGTTVAVKTLIGNNEITSEEYDAEVELLSYLHHPNIVLFMGATKQPRSMVTEYVARGSLYDVISKERLSTKLIKQIAYGIAQGMAYLHGHQPPVIHRDLKSQNILITKNYQAKIADFGLSRTLKIDQTMTRRAGTTRWTAPEVLEGGRYTEKADIYSFAIILWEMLAGEGNAPFSDERWEARVEKKVIAGERPEIPNKNNQPQQIVDLIERCWASDSDQRPTFDQIVELLK